MLIRRGGVSVWASIGVFSFTEIKLDRNRGYSQSHGICICALKDCTRATSNHPTLTISPKKTSHLYQCFFHISANVDINQLFLSKPDIATLASIIRRCGSCNDLYNGKIVHRYIKQHRHQHNKYLNNCLVLMYADCGRMDVAQEVFDGIACPNSFSWSILIKGYAQNGKLDKARHILDSIPNADVVVWNTMISAYAHEQEGMQALDLFKQMVQKGNVPDKATFLCILEACTSLPSLGVAEDFLRIFGESKYSEDVTLRTALIHLYGKCGRLDDAVEIFDNMSLKDAVTWNAIITMFAQTGHHKKALDISHKMRAQNVAPTHVTFVSTLDACAGLRSLKEGTLLHVRSVFYAFENDIAVGNALINMYGKCGWLLEAVNAFDKIHQCSVVSWTALITAYLDNDQAEQAFLVFRKMQDNHNICPNKVTFICALDACCQMQTLDKGLVLHFEVTKRAYECDVLIGTSLINMYGKCGFTNDAFSVFRQIEKQDVASWNAILTVCARNGNVIWAGSRMEGSTSCLCVKIWKWFLPMSIMLV